VTFVIRRATADDALGIATVNVTSWRESYSAFLSDSFLSAMSIPDRAVGWRTSAERNTIHVLDVDGEVRGFSVARAHPELELRLLYQVASEHGSGSGQALLDAAIGDSPAFLWVAELNPRAQAFYRRNGFEPDGERKVTPQWENLVEIRMVR
jgi:ribosomal protein S18 acetylase RimI-like enzyme